MPLTKGPTVSDASRRHFAVRSSVSRLPLRTAHPAALLAPSSAGLVALQVVAFTFASALVGELLQWWFVYRKPEWKMLKANLEKALAKVEEAKAGGSGAEGERAKQKREKALEKWKQEATHVNAKNSVKTTLIVRVEGERAGLSRAVADCHLFTNFTTLLCSTPFCIKMTAVLLGSFKLMNNLFGDTGAVLQLPFEPPAFIQRVAQRGITDANPRDASAVGAAGVAES